MHPETSGPLAEVIGHPRSDRTRPFRHHVGLGDGAERGPELGRDLVERRDLVGVAVADRHHILDTRRRTVAHVDPRRGTSPERHGQRHVGRLARRRRVAVREIQVPVEIRHAGAPQDVARRGQGSRQLGAAAAHQERPLAGHECRGRRLADRRGRRQHIGTPQDPGDRIPYLAPDTYVQVAGVRAEELAQPQLAELRRSVLGSPGPAHRIDRHADEREVGRHVSLVLGGPWPVDTPR